jgi:hypothetical protein
VASKHRQAENEAIFRGANERLEQYAASNVNNGLGRVLPFLCECDRTDCTKVVLVTRPEYERVRADSRRSVLVRGHDNPEIERVVEETDRYVVTEKFGVAAEVYGELDPRS